MANLIGGKTRVVGDLHTRLASKQGFMGTEQWTKNWEYQTWTRTRWYSILNRFSIHTTPIPGLSTLESEWSVDQAGSSRLRVHMRVVFNDNRVRTTRRDAQMRMLLSAPIHIVSYQTNWRLPTIMGRTVCWQHMV